MKTSHLVLVLIASAVAFSVRLVPMPMYNFSALSALAILCGTVMRPAWHAVLIPVAVRLLTDGVIHLSTGYGFYDSMSFDYVAYAVIAGIAYLVQPKQIPQAVGISLLATMLFFAVSNFGVWCMPHAGQYLYPRTLEGLINCYRNGLPFLKGTFVSDMVFTLAFVTGMHLVLLRSAETEQPAAGEAR